MLDSKKRNVLIYIIIIEAIPKTECITLRQTIFRLSLIGDSSKTSNN
jgi:hypothetical protein